MGRERGSYGWCAQSGSHRWGLPSHSSTLTECLIKPAHTPKATSAPSAITLELSRWHCGTPAFGPRRFTCTRTYIGRREAPGVHRQTQDREQTCTTAEIRHDCRRSCLGKRKAHAALAAHVNNITQLRGVNRRRYPPRRRPRHRHVSPLAGPGYLSAQHSPRCGACVWRPCR